MAGLNKKYNTISIWMSAVMLLAFQSSFIAANAQGISVSAPSHVQTGENFRVEYQIDTQDVSDFQSGLRNSDLVEIIAGPSTSRRSSIQMVNGHINNSSSITYTYILYAQKNGTLTLPSAHARVGSKTLSSKPVRVTISGYRLVHPYLETICLLKVVLTNSVCMSKNLSFLLIKSIHWLT